MVEFCNAVDTRIDFWRMRYTNSKAKLMGIEVA